MISYRTGNMRKKYGNNEGKEQVYFHNHTEYLLKRANEFQKERLKRQQVQTNEHTQVTEEKQSFDFRAVLEKAERLRQKAEQVEDKKEEDK